jgi:hypothetical protein
MLSLLLVFVSIGSFYGSKKIVHNPERKNDYYQVYSIVNSAFYVDAVVRNLDFRTQYMNIRDDNGEYIRNPRLMPGDEWKEQHQQKYGNQNPVLMSLRLAYEKPLLVLQQMVFNPFFAFCLSSTEGQTLFHFVVNFSLLLLALLGIVKIGDKSLALSMHLCIVLSVYVVLIMIHSRAPYFLPVIPYLLVFSGKPINRNLSQLLQLRKK